MAKEQGMFNQLQLVIGAAVVLLGGLVYLFDRPAWALPFLPEYFAQIPAAPQYLSEIGQIFPAFSHTVGFTLLTVGVLAAGRFAVAAAASFWVVINLIFEFAQYPSVAPLMIEMLPQWLEGSFIVERTRCYLQGGTFDVNDVIAILLGAGVACVVAWGTMDRRKS